MDTIEEVSKLISKRDKLLNKNVNGEEDIKQDLNNFKTSLESRLTELNGDNGDNDNGNGKAEISEEEDIEVL